MSRITSRLVAAILMVSVPSVLRPVAAAERPGPAATAERPDPAAVERFGPAYRYPSAGWIVVHVEGDPYERGYQQGRLLAPEIAAYIKTLATRRGAKAPADLWRQNRTFVNALFLRRYDPEYLEEMKGIAAGAAAAGARFDDRPLDLIDIVAVNSEFEVACLDGALAATPTGLEGRTFAEPDDKSPRRRPPERCSAFAATGPATADGSIVIGHITMDVLDDVPHYNIWLDLKPSKGHRIVMQTYPGGIQSGMDYYLNDAGLVVAETTLTQTRFESTGQAVASRIRKALQYADSIDGVVAILGASNNGMYTNEWILADTKTNEIALFELGTHKSKLWRSSRDEWFGGTRGFYWGCNNVKDLQVRMETVPSVEARAESVVFHPAPRDRAWLRLFEAHKEKIDRAFGFEAFSTPPIVAFSSCDAKFTTTALAKELKTYAVFGPPLGRTWEPSHDERDNNPEIRPIVPNDWVLLDTEAPPSADPKAAPAVDLASSKKDDLDKEKDDPHDHDITPAWHGTLLPRDDGDVWLAAAFGEYETIVAEERAVRKRAKERALHDAEKDRLELGPFAWRSRYLTAVARSGDDTPLARIKVALGDDTWYEIAAGKGVLLLSALRARLGDAAFLALMDRFGRAHAGKPVSSADFRAAVERDWPGGDKAPPPLDLDAWLTRPGLPDDSHPAGAWAVESFEHDPRETLIVYGTRREASAQREAAERLQKAIAHRGSNVLIPIIADTDASDDALKANHLLLIGRPESNAVAARLDARWPVDFERRTFSLRDKTYAHPTTAVIAAAPHPGNPKRSVVIFAGLGAQATRRCIVALEDHEAPRSEVILLVDDAKPRRMVVPARLPKCDEGR